MKDIIIGSIVRSWDSNAMGLVVSIEHGCLTMHPVHGEKVDTSSTFTGSIIDYYFVRKGE